MQTKFIDLGLVYVSFTTYMRVYGQTTQFLTSRMNQTTKKKHKKVDIIPKQKANVKSFSIYFPCKFFGLLF
jgi:hypothetical protein